MVPFPSCCLLFLYIVYYATFCNCLLFEFQLTSFMLLRNLSGLYLFLQDVELSFPWPQISRSAVSSLKIDAGHAVPS